MMRRRRGLMIAAAAAPAGVLKTVGPSATIHVTDALAGPVDDLTAAIVYTQSGSGNPSPSNVRPISGYTGVTVSRSGADTSNPTTFALSWQSTAGTVYGGTIDLTTGLLTVTHAGVNITATNRYEKDGGYFWNTTAAAQGIPNIKSTSADLVCERLIKANNIGVSTASGKVVFFDTGIIRWKEQDSLSLADYQTYLTQNPLLIVYEMATPATYQLTPESVSLIRGENNVWADTGNVTLQYYGTA